MSTVDDLVGQHLWVAEWLTRRTSRRFRWVDRDELSSAAMEGLWRAAAGHRPEAGVFITFAASCVRNALTDAVRTQHARRQRPGERALSLDLARDDDDRSLHEALCDRRPGPEEVAEVAEDLARLASAMTRLDEDDRAALELRFVDGCTLAAIGSAAAHDKANESRRQQRTLCQLRDALDEGD